MATIEEILARREARQETRTQLHNEFKRPVVVFTLNIPGMEKNSPLYKQAHKSGEAALAGSFREQGIEILRTCIVYGACGREALFVARSEDPRLLKELCLSIEESHPLGRIFDMDVYGTDGAAVHRTDIGLGPRCCFVCDAPAAECARSQRHDTEELFDFIDRRIGSFFRETSPRKKERSRRI